jgi:hypothetical protein
MHKVFLTDFVDSQYLHFLVSALTMLPLSSTLINEGPIQSFDTKYHSVEHRMMFLISAAEQRKVEKSIGQPNCITQQVLLSSSTTGTQTGRMPPKRKFSSSERRSKSPVL